MRNPSAACSALPLPRTNPNMIFIMADESRAQEFSAEELAHRALEHRALEAVIWGMPAALDETA